MKKAKRIICVSLAFLLIAAAAVVLSGCGEKTASVESLLKIDGEFAGSRSISVVFPFDFDKEVISAALKSNMPVYEGDSEAFALSECITAEGGNRFTFDINFSSFQDYTDKVSALLGREASVAAAKPDNILTTGVRISEDFSVSELIHWMIEAVSDAVSADNLNYAYTSNTVNINGEIYSAGEQIDIAEIEGYPIESIKIETGNTKDGRYERRFTLAVSDAVYQQLGDRLKNYFESLTDDRAVFNGWSLQGGNQEYLVIFQDLNVTELCEVTNKMLGTDDCEVFYGDETNASTPLSEGLDFEEKLNLSNFFSADNQSVPLTYTYSLPAETTKGDAQLYSRGQWIAAGEWQGTTFSYEGSSNMIRLKIPDGIQYRIESINYTLQNEGDGYFTRTLDFLYSSYDGQKAQSYAYNYLSTKGANVTKLSIGEYIACRVTVQGTPGEISMQTAELFGSGNYTAYSTKSPRYSLTTNTSFKDYINISYLLNAQNSSVPIKYTVIPNSSESLRKLEASYADVSQSVSKPDKSGSFTVTFTGGQAEISYSGVVANPGAIRSYTLFSVLLTVITVCFCILFCCKDLKHKGRREAVSKKQPLFRRSSEGSAPENVREEENDD